MLDFIISVRSIHLFLIELAVDSQLIYYNVNLCLCDEKKKTCIIFMWWAQISQRTTNNTFRFIGKYIKFMCVLFCIMYVWKYDVIMYNVRIAILYYVEYFIIEYKVVCFEFVANLPRDDLERLHKLKTSWTAVNWYSIHYLFCWLWIWARSNQFSIIYRRLILFCNGVSRFICHVPSQLFASFVWINYWHWPFN